MADPRQAQRKRHRETAGFGGAEQLFGVGALGALEPRGVRIVSGKSAAAELDPALAAVEIAPPFRLCDISPTFSEALRIDTRAGCWIFISGQVGVPLPPDKGSVTFEQEVRTTFERIRDSLGKLGAGMNHVVSIKTYLTDLGPYAVFSRIRGESFPKDPPTSTAVQVAGLLIKSDKTDHSAAHKGSALERTSK